MTLTVAERARLSQLWRAVAAAAVAGDAEALSGVARACQAWASPLEEKADAFVLFALSRLSYAYVTARTQAARAQRRPALGALGLLALSLLGDPPPATPPPPPAQPGFLPYRDD